MDNKDIMDNKDTFEYRVNDLPGKMKKQSIFVDLFAPRNISKTRMYLLFVLGSLALLSISFISVNGVNFYGQDTYLQYFLEYVNTNRDLAYTSFIIMVVINIFWIIINIIIEFLANFRGWIPPKKQTESDLTKSSIKNKYFKKTFQTNNTFDENQYYKDLAEKQEKDAITDKNEFDAILSNAALSPLAFLWVAVKSVYRMIFLLPRRIHFLFVKFNKFIEKKIWQMSLFFTNLKDLILYFLNPFNLIEEVIDSAITILVKFLYPSILTPLIFFVPVRYSIYLENIPQIILYFFIIGGLRLGVEFYSIYIRFVRNTRL